MTGSEKRTDYMREYMRERWYPNNRESWNAYRRDRYAKYIEYMERMRKAVESKEPVL